MDPILNAEIENAEQCLLESYELMAIYGNEELRDPKPFLKYMEELCNIKNEAENAERAIQIARQQNSIDDFNEVYQQNLNNVAPFAATKSKKYKNFQTRLQQMMDASGVQSNEQNLTSNPNRVECEEFVMESQINIFDPLTKLRMQDPVRNDLCGHHYEKSTIMEAIQINRRLKCPVAGCGNNQFIQAQHLQPDNVLKMRLMQMVQTGSEDPLAV